jgi:hypothetical protein
LVRDERSAILRGKPTYIPVLLADAPLRKPQKLLLTLLAVVGAHFLRFGIVIREAAPEVKFGLPTP